MRQVTSGMQGRNARPHRRTSADQTLRQPIFTCDCECKYIWSPGQDYDELCRHVLAVTTALSVDTGMVKGKEV